MEENEIKEEVKVGQKVQPETKTEAKPGFIDKLKERYNALPEAERKKRKDIVAFTTMGLVFIIVMLIMFYPDSKEKKSSTEGFNIELPDAVQSGIAGDKAKIYEQDAMSKRQEQREHSVQALGDVLQQEQETTDEFDLSANEPAKSKAENKVSSIQTSATAYKDLNSTLGSFYEPVPLAKNEDKALEDEIARLEKELEEERMRNNSNSEIELMEKSYELAAKYMGGQNGKTAVKADETIERKPTINTADKPTATPVKRVTEQVVSALEQPMSDEEFLSAYSTERNYGFNTAIGKSLVSDKNTLAACIYGTQTVTDGQMVRMRLLEPMAVDERVIPKGGTLVGAAKIQGERLEIEITSLEHEGMIIPIELAVYDTDGQPGIFIPNSMELNAVKEIAADMGSNLGTSINISTNAGAQLASDLGRSAIQGTSQYIAQKMRTVKVHLKNGYRVMLYQERN